MMTGIPNTIVPHLWYDKEAKEAAEFYASVFPDSKVTNLTTLHDTPSGDMETATFEISGQRFMAIGAGPQFKFNPSVSFMVNFDPSVNKRAKEALETVWDKLSKEGKPLMPLDRYPFSDLYGWIEDKYGISWQLILTNPDGEPRPAIIPSLLFVSDTGEQAEEATNYYLSVFNQAKRGQLARYPGGMEPNKEGAIMFTDFTLENQWFAAMDGNSHIHNFAFNEAISFVVYCESQKDIDYFWTKLSAVPEAEQCGWLKDKYGVSWQIVPAAMHEMMTRGTRQQIDRLTQTFMPMKKLELEELKRAYEGPSFD